MRAAASGLLNCADGCPLTRRYALKELWILRDLEREDALALQRMKLRIDAAGAQLLSYNPAADQVVWRLYEAGMTRAAAAYQRAGSLLQPWDVGWQEALDQTEKRLYDDANMIGDTGLSDKSITALIKEYEEVKKKRESRRESGGSDAA